MGKPYKHLDKEYRRRWIEFELDDGTVKDSREKNWRDIEWLKVNKITVNMVGKIYCIDKNNKLGFKGFMNFRWFGRDAKFDKNNKFIGYDQIHIWTIGWTDGIKCYLKDINFHGGRLVKEYEVILKEFRKHIHPDLKLLVEE